LLYLLNKDVRTVRWNGEPLHEATSAVVKETMNGDFTLTVKYPISDSGIYQLIQEDMLIKAPTPVLGAQLFRIKKPVENNDHLEITAYHISDDVMQRSITPMSVTSQSCGMALSRMVQNTKTALGDFSFNSDIQDRRTFNTTETETLYSVLLDGKHSIVGTWEGELVRDNFAMTIKKSRGENRGVVITTHKNLKDYQRTRNSQNVVTRIHAKSTFKPEGAEKETTIRVTVDSPLINSYPYINEKEYENNNAKTVEELQKWAQAKFTNQGIDKVSDAIKIEAFELDGQVVHIGDTVNLKSWKHNVDAFKKAIAYEFDALKEEYISLTFDDKAGTGGSRASGGLSSAADAILGVTGTAQEIALEKALQNADLGFDHQAGLLRQEILDGIELARARAEEVKKELSDNIDQRFNSFNNGPLQEALRNSGASTLLAQEAKRIGLDSVAKLEAFKSQATNVQTALSGDLDTLKLAIANDIRPKQAQAEAEIAKQVEALNKTKNELAGVKSAQSTYEETTTRRLAELTNLANGKASKSELTQTAEELASKIASVRVGGRNYYRDSEKVRTSTRFFSFPLHPYFTQENVGETWTLSFDLKINEGGEIRPLHFYHYQTNRFGLRASADITPSKEWKRFTFTGPVIFPNDDPRYSRGEMALYDYGGNNNYSVRRIKLEKGNVATDWSPALEDIEGQISTVESNFRQRADALDAGVSRLTEGLRTKADISSLNVTAENIRQSVKSLETSTQNKLDQKLSQAEFEVQAGSIRQEILNATKDKADKTLVVAEAGKLREEFSNLRVGGTNLLKGSKGPFLPDRKPANFDNAILYVGQTSIYMEQGQEYIISAKTDGTFTAHHDGNKESDNVVLWIMDKDVRNYQIVSDLKTGTTGTKIIWNKPTGIYHLRVNTYHKEATKSVWDVKIEKGNVATDWSPAPEDTDGLITEAKAIFERTAQGLRTDLSAIQEYVNKDGQRQDALQRYAREESAKQATAVRELVARDYVGKSTYQEDVRGLERRFEAITNPQNGSIATQIANYKQSVDGRFADITSLISGKANQTDFQRVKETSQLYERILGNTENGIADKVARMAMTNQLFQVEVGKAFAGHQNLFLNSTLTKGFLGNNGIIYVANATQKEVTSDFISVDPNEKIIFQHWVTLPENGMAWTAWQFFDKNKKAIDARVTGLNAYKTATGKQHNINQIIVPANAYFIRVSARMYNDGLIKIERGSAPSNYSAAPEDTDEAIRTVQTQLAGSWGVYNKNSVNEIIAGFNLAGRNAGIKAETIRLEGNTLADKLTAIDGYFKRLFVGEGTFATLNADVIRTNSITADKLVFNEALANRMVSNEHITNKLVASRAFVNALKAVTIDASQIVTGTLKGDRIYGGTIRGTEINGTTITGNSRMTIGDNGFLRPTQEGGLQINVPETYSANKGIGVQLFGRNFGKIPKGMFIYNSPNWNGGNIIGDNTEDILLTVKGRVSLCNLHNGSPVSGVPIISNFEYQNPIRNLYPIRFIGWDPRSNQLYVDDGTGKSGTWWISVDGSTSDKNLKTNIGDTHYNALDFVQKLMFKEFDWKTDKFGYKKPYTNVGLIAQDVEKIDSSLVYKKGETLALDDFRLLNIALKAIQELALENRKLTHRLENLENERRTA